jgi:flagellar biosynthesis protein FliP
MRWILPTVVAPALVALAVLAALAGLAGPALAQPLSVPQPPSPVTRPLPAEARVQVLAAAAMVPAAPGPAAPRTPRAPGGAPGGEVDVNLGTAPSSSIVAILALTMLAVAPALLLMCTSFTKILVVLSLTRNALGLTSVPPNQVLAGLALFLSLFVMGPVLSKVNDAGVQPYLKGAKTQTAAFRDGMAPLRTFMEGQTRREEITLLHRVNKTPEPAERKDVALTTLIPAFVLSELRSAFIIGFVIFIPFLVIDLVVSSALMSMGMMMLPPVMISLPFKLLLFVLVDGWALVVKALVSSYG